MSKIEKLIQKILNGQSISYEEAEKLFNRLGFDLNVETPIMFFEKMGTQKTFRLSAIRAFILSARGF
jgi:hypothetical protein